ncbi:MAG: beta-galactosidase [Planctomycetes bacterium GWF2_41_51]|nr:MAG: beta-galactosidase [Planctomycetes bacterium GWF2_41_51]HBG26039.1 beta-galactosidase [Phycisphaerales bacterium]
MSLPRSEYPRPQWVRDQWLCLNGTWEFEIDNDNNGLERGLVNRHLDKSIIVPFCPESELSGIGFTGFMKAVWYRKEIEIPPKWVDKKILLHFQAVDYDATVWINGINAGSHRGGWTGFTIDLRNFASADQKIVITVRARDDMKNAMPRGKQSMELQNHDCVYTRTTGIWQTVWLEAVSEIYLRRPKITPFENKSFLIEQASDGDPEGLRVKVTLKDTNGKIAEKISEFNCFKTAVFSIAVPENKIRLWSSQDPFLYDLEFELINQQSKVIDSAKSYAGLREIKIEGKKVKINGKSIFQRLVLDQGYYPDGIMTAPNEEALIRDIQISLEAGFNGTRLHQKVFEERFLYHCDRLGYLVWGEFGDWGLTNGLIDEGYNQPGAAIVAQWMEVLERDYSHPAIIGWCPLNELLQVIEDRYTFLNDVMKALFWITKGYDKTRPVIDVSGFSHRVFETDIYDSHLYVQDPELFSKMMGGLKNSKPFINDECGCNINSQMTGRTVSLPYRGQPYFVSEFGGIWWNQEAALKAQNDTGNRNESWGYGDRSKTIDEFYKRFEGLCSVLLKNPDMFGYCYTQLTDVFQEQNGIYNFDRSLKFDMAKIWAVQQQKAAIEVF